MLAQCDAVVANTEFEAQFIEQQAGVRAIAGGVGFQSELFEKRNGREIRDRYGIGNDEVIGFVGRQLHNKGIATLIRAMCKVWPVQPNARLLIAGPRPPADRELEYLMSSLTDFERQHIIVVNGFSDEEKSSIYDAMDIFVLPSTGESFGIAYLEAWMCDKPVIGARIGPTQCVIQDGIDGLLVTPQDDEDTARAILELLADPYRRTVMGRIGHSKTVEQFTWERVTDRVEALLGNVAGERTAPGIAAAECVGSSKCGKH
jgi:glycosyltransferase involved in cell wall biosynthesis